MSDPRTLRSKRLRAALWIAADGHCQNCGEPLQEGWHADHIKPWVDTRRTNVHEMQALCPTCNLQKGASMRLRKHQQEGISWAGDLITHQAGKKVITAAVTPGGGKSLLATLFANALIDGGVVNAVCWVCPRLSLAGQAEEGFYQPDRQCIRQIRKSDNTPPLVRGEACGYVTTYQSIDANPELHAHEFRRKRYLLILDEPHHLCEEDGKSWVGSMRPLVDSAVQVLAMTGTIERHDGKRIPFIEYNGTPPVPLRHIEYTRTDALAERAVLPIAFEWLDGSARYLDGDTEKTVDISKASDEEISKVIRTFLGKNAYRDALVRRGLDHWTNYCANVYRSRAIIVCDSQPMARDIAKLVKDEYQVQVALAISDEPDAQRTLSQFRHGQRGEVLVTVGMAYEGLDVPDCTHLICLTSTRSVPWLEQAFARVTRVDFKCGIPYEQQCAHIFVPDDPKMRSVVRQMRDEELEGLREREKRDREANTQDGQENIFVGLDAQHGAVRHGDLNGQFSDADSQLIERLKGRIPAIKHVPSFLIRDIGRAWSTERPSATIGAAVPHQTLSQEEGVLRKDIQKIANGIDRSKGWAPGSTNTLIMKRFDKSREAMSLEELRSALDYLNTIRRAS